MRQVSKFWAIAPIALLAAFWAQPTVSSPVSDAVGVSNRKSSSLILKSPAAIAQESPKPSPSPQRSRLR
jgi:hypothetical protein